MPVVGQSPYREVGEGNGQYLPEPAPVTIAVLPSTLNSVEAVPVAISSKSKGRLMLPFQSALADSGTLYTTGHAISAATRTMAGMPNSQSFGSCRLSATSVMESEGAELEARAWEKESRGELRLRKSPQ